VKTLRFLNDEKPRKVAEGRRVCFATPSCSVRMAARRAAGAERALRRRASRQSCALLDRVSELWKGAR
jgi:hypothetical protein